MEYKVGDRVVYPNHGVAVVETVEATQIGGQHWDCYRLRILANNACVVVPKQNAASVGLRKTARKQDVRSVLDRLRGDSVAVTANWKGRFQQNSDRMRSGQLREVAEVLKGLAHLAASRPLSYREKMMLEKARELVVNEIAAVERTPVDAVGDLVDQALGIAPRAGEGN